MKLFGEFCRDRKTPALGIYDVGSTELVKKYSSVEVDANGRLLSFEEKPTKPSSTLSGIALYYYPKEVLPMVDRYIAEGYNPDQPGRLMSWIYQQTPVYTWKVQGHWYDIGSRDELEEANRVFLEMQERGAQ